MRLDPDLCYRAWVTRDRRFDGRFFMGVTTTGIYCRPGCPARLPARRNVRFYPSAAAAETEGFRPCRRCRPETAPGSAAALGTHATVGRALRLIEEGALEQGSVERLAARLGVTDRWLRELFAQQLGASPLEVAQTRRAHLARRLLDETALPLSQVALASGFAGERQLRRALQRTFHRNASELRGNAATPEGAALTLWLPAREPFDAAPILQFLGSRAIPGIEEVVNDVYRRTIVLEGTPCVLAIAPDATRGVRLSLTPPIARSLPRVAAKVARLFDLDADVGAIRKHLSGDPVLARMLKAGPVRVPGAWDPFELAVRAMLGQQVSVAAARTLAARLVQATGVALDRPSGSLTHCFPTAEAIAVTPLSFHAMPRARARALQGLARAVADGVLDLSMLRDLQHAVAELTALPGIGDWTAQYVAMRALSEPDAFPASDLGVRKALAQAGRMPTPNETLRRAESWRPWRSYAVFTLWRSLAAPLRRKGSS
ncbi:MAG: Ada metal-binding domain-containing protein [Candidatus Eisenbacteria bacterium]